ncbi:hypothetical protein VSP20_04970 [Myroides phaeus]|uniref:hypothetical protein n=1 Tax=Myroides phaeus TaxID=702745 RepID=UPI002DBED8D3|nr:hypothetical protein [Myroides phaeus]MEC4116316.1 hypothetical protein [Myroides phaeus]
MKKILLFLLFVFTSQLGVAQTQQNNKRISFDDISKKQWVVQDKEKDLQLKFNGSKIILTRVSEPVIVGQEKTIVALIPVPKINIINGNIRIKTGKPSIPSNQNNKPLSPIEKDVLKLLTKRKLYLNASNESLFFIENIEHFQEFYSEHKYRMTQFLSKFMWQLIQLDGNTDVNTTITIAFDFAQQLLTGTIDGVPFESRLQINATDSTFYFEPIQFTTNFTKPYTAPQKAFISKFDNTFFHFDIAEQTVNFYKHNQLVMMFGLVKKED